MKIDSEKAIDLVMRLMAVEGKSCEEAKVAQLIIEELKAFGVSDSAIGFDTAHKRTPLKGEIGNLIVKLPGDRKLPRIMLSAHMDTVPICVGCVPKRVGRKIVSANKSTGLGADDRAGVAAVLTSAREVLQSGRKHPPLTLSFFVQEEIGLQGSRNMTVSKLARPEMALNFDGGDPYKMTIGATGGERIKITLTGIPAHAGIAPENGASAIEAAGLAIASLKKGKWLGAVKKKGETGTSNIGRIEGGVATNVVADSVHLFAEARSHSSEFRTAIAQEIEDAFESSAAQVVSAQGGSVSAKVERRVDYDSFCLDEESPAVKRVAEAIQDLGAEPKCNVSNGGVDANWIVKHGIPTVTVGCGQREVHTNQETLDIADFLAACEIGTRVVLAG